MTEFFTRSGSPIAPDAVMSEDAKGGCAYRFVQSCHRCGGLGGSEAWRHTGWTCYECGGVGKWPAVGRGYSAEKLAKLDASLEKRRAKLEEARKAKQAAKDAELQAQVDAYTAEHPAAVAWLVANAKTDDYGVENFAGSLLSGLNKFGALTEKQLAAVERIVEQDRERAEQAKLSTHVGQVKDRVTMQLTVERVLDWSYGSFPTIYRFCNLCRDEHGNRIKYVGGKALDDGAYKVTIKEHEEYKGEKVTVVERPKLV